MTHVDQLWRIGAQGRKKADFILYVMIQHGATVCIREVILGGLLIQMESLISADLGTVNP